MRLTAAGALSSAGAGMVGRRRWGAPWPAGPAAGSGGPRERVAPVRCRRRSGVGRARPRPVVGRGHRGGDHGARPATASRCGASTPRPPPSANGHGPGPGEARRRRGRASAPPAGPPRARGPTRERRLVGTPGRCGPCRGRPVPSGPTPWAGTSSASSWWRRPTADPPGGRAGRPGGVRAGTPNGSATASPPWSGGGSSPAGGAGRSPRWPSSLVVGVLALRSPPFGGRGAGGPGRGGRRRGPGLLAHPRAGPASSGSRWWPGGRGRERSAAAASSPPAPRRPPGRRVRPGRPGRDGYAVDRPRPAVGPRADGLRRADAGVGAARARVVRP